MIVQVAVPDVTLELVELIKNQCLKWGIDTYILLAVNWRDEYSGTFQVTYKAADKDVYVKMAFRVSRANATWDKHKAYGLEIFR